MEEQKIQKETGSKGKLVIAYLISIVGLIFIYTDKTADEKTKSHYKQAGTLFIINVLNTIVINGILSGFIPFSGQISYLISALLFVASIIAAVKAYKDEFFEIPVIFNLSKTIFK